MELPELEALVAGGESDLVEFKRTTAELTSGARTACAMLNGGRGGWVLFGVRDDGRIAGQEVTSRTLEEVANALRRIEPRAEVRVEAVPVGDGRAVVVARVPESRVVHTFDRVPYERIANTTGSMPDETYRRRIVDEAMLANPWDRRVAEGCTIADLDATEIVLTVEEAIRRQRLEEPGTREIVPLLLGLDLVEEGRPRKAALVLFGREERVRNRFPQCLLRMARFRGTTKSEFDDNRQFAGNAFATYRVAQRFYIDHLPVAGRVLPDQFERVDEPLYPTEALREAIANAICHRDYVIPGDSLGLAIYDDRLEVSSPGPLPFGLTPEDLRRPHASRRRNDLIAGVFYRRGLIEQWGRGTLKMIELCREAGIPEPEFESGRYETIARFRHGRALPKSAEITGLSPLQAEVLAILMRDGALAFGEIAARLSVPQPRRTLQDNLRRLRDDGLIAQIGEGRRTRWGVSV